VSPAADPGSVSSVPDRRLFATAVRWTALALVFVAALFGSGLLFTKVRPFATVGMVREKFAHFAAHKDEYDTLFIGSSRVYRGIMPALFDEITASHGRPTRSFNFGIDGMFPPEDGYVFDAIAGLRPKNLRTVFIESSMFSANFENREPESPRMVHWHDWERTRLICTDVLQSKKGGIRWSRALSGAPREREKFQLALTHFRLFVMRALSLGRGQVFVREMFERPRPSPQKSLGIHNDGFLPMKVRSWMPPLKLAEYRRQMAERRAKPALKVEVRPSPHANLERMFGRVRALGAEPVVFISPMLGGTRLYPRASSGVPVLDFTDLETRAELFAEEHRADTSPLTGRGAELFTRALAADFIELGTRAKSSR